MSRTRDVSRAALAVWACAMVTYVLAVAARTSLGVSGVEALERFHMGAGALALFSSLQVGVYGASQIPVGLLLDRLGPRRLLSAGAVLVALAQLGMACAPSLHWALAARVLLGIGDATAFISVLRLLPSWFPVRRIPFFTQLTSILGLVGQVISAGPFLMLLHHAGWSLAFAVMSALGLAAAFLVLARVKDTPSRAAGPAGPAPASPEPSGAGAEPSAAVAVETVDEVIAGMGGKLREPDDGDGALHGVRTAPEDEAPEERESVGTTFVRVMASPWTWLGFFSHWSAGPPMTFSLLWGVPFMTLGMGLSAPTASLILIVVFTGSNMLLGPLVGQLTARRPRWRVRMVAGSMLASATAWVLVLAGTTPAPAWAACLLAVALSTGGVCSSIGFDFVREGTPPSRLGTATGATNVGGFFNTLVMVQAIGIALDVAAGGGAYGWASFRLALAVQAVPWVVGFIGLWCARAAVRRRAPEARL